MRLSEDLVRRVRVIRADHDRAVLRELGRRAKKISAGSRARICYRVARDIEEKLGLEHVLGVYVGAEVNGYDEGDGNYYHEWNEDEDGVIVDATADQFGDADPVRVLALDDPGYGDYWPGGRPR